MHVKTIIAAALMGLVVGTSALWASAQPEAASLVVYSGRGESLVGPLLQQFEAETGIKVEVRYAGTPELARLILEEGAQSPADIFWAQDVGSLGGLHAAGVLKELPPDLLQGLDANLLPSTTTWVPLSGRARVLAYSPERVPAATGGLRLEDLTAPAYRGRVGFAPGNASFQLAVTALNQIWGREKTLAWLQALKANEARVYPNNSSQLAAIAAGEIDLGLVNHYYLLRELAKTPGFPVRQAAFQNGDAGNLMNVSGAGILQTSKNQAAALRFLRYMVSAKAQTYFVEKTFEYPVLPGTAMPGGAPDLQEYRGKAPAFDWNALNDLEGALQLIKDAGLL